MFSHPTIVSDTCHVSPAFDVVAIVNGIFKGVVIFNGKVASTIMQCVVSPHERKSTGELLRRTGGPADQVRPQSLVRRPTTYDFGDLPRSEIARHDPSALHFNVDTAPAGVLGADVDCVQVRPASDVKRNVPKRCEGEPEVVPVTPNTQWLASPQAKPPGEGSVFGTGIADDFQ
jgi:hypothetical protein